MSQVHYSVGNNENIKIVIRIRNWKCVIAIGYIDLLKMTAMRNIFQ